MGMDGKGPKYQEQPPDEPINPEDGEMNIAGLLPIIMKAVGGVGGLLGGGGLGSVLGGLMGGGQAPPLPGGGPGGGPSFTDISPVSAPVPQSPTVGPGFVPGGGVQPSGAPAPMPSTTELQKTTNAATTAGEKTKPYVGPIQEEGGGLAPSGDNRQPKDPTKEKQKEKKPGMTGMEKAATAAQLTGALMNTAKGPALPNAGSGFSRIDPTALQFIMKGQM